MSYIYIDESGDLGFSEKGSKDFIISAVVINDEETHKKFRRIPKKIRQRKLKKSLKKQSELKFSNSSVLIREQFLTRAAKLPIKVYVLIIKKEYTQEKLKNYLDILYNYLIKILLEKAFTGINNHDKLTICLDKCMSQKQRDNFEAYIKTEFLFLFQKLPDVKISHELSHHRPSLQVTDFICGAFGYKYNNRRLKEGCDQYTSIIKERIEVEKVDLFKEKKANHTYLS